VKRYTLSLLLLTLTVVILTSLCVGAASVNLPDLLDALLHPTAVTITHGIIWDVRLPRILAALLCGASLAMAGAVLQATFANSIVDSALIGISGSAACGAALALLIAPLAQATSASIAGSLLGAALAVIILVSTRQVGLRFTLFGIALGATASALLALIGSDSHRANGRSLVSWLFGSLSLTTWSGIAAVTISLVLGSVMLRGQGQLLDVGSFGVQSATHLGIDMKRQRLRWLITITVLVAPSVALFGAIGFVGLAVPHISRMLGAVNHRTLLPVSAIVGAGVLTLADTTSRTIAGPMEIPLSITMALIGAPILFIVLRGMRDE
jgi:iron complex transport system permease protein